MATTNQEPKTPEEIKAYYTDRYYYFCLCGWVANAPADEKAFATRYLRNVMLLLGYPAETKGWTDEQTQNYARNIVAMG